MPFYLLSDDEGKVHEIFDVIKPLGGAERSTFVFDKDGELVKEYRKVKVDGHANEVLDYVKTLK